MKFKSFLFWSLVFASPLMLSSLVAFSYGDNAMGDSAELDSFNNSMFGDVPLDHKNYDAIYFLKNYDPEIIQGYATEDSDLREYKPDNKINRAEFLKLILEGTDNSIDASYEKCFPDVPVDEWYAKYVCYAKEEGMINGYPDGTFKPDQTINEVEAVKILGEVQDWDLPDLGDNYEWYEPYMEFANNRNVVPEENIGMFMTRADIAEMIYRNLQVALLNIRSFVEDLIDEMFYQYGIPLSGPMGPGGLLGPGGPFGDSGAFYTGDYFRPDGEFDILDDDFYAENYCYLSDSEEFRTRVKEILAYVRGEDVEDVEIGSNGIDDFGTLHCYSQPLDDMGDLILLTEDLRNEYSVKCWEYDNDAVGVGGNYKELLCYKEPEEPEWLNAQPYCVYEEDLDGNYCETCYDNYYSGLILSQECTDGKLVACCMPGYSEEVCVKTSKQNCEYGGGRWLPGITWCSPDPCNQQNNDDKEVASIEVSGVRDITASGGTSSANLEFFVTDENGDPLDYRSLMLTAVSGVDYHEDIPVTEVGGGVYMASFSSKLSGSFTLTLLDYETGYETIIPIRVKPGSLDHAEIVDVVEPYESGSIDTAYLKVVAKDRYDNVLPYSSVNNNLSATTTLGSVNVNHDSDGIFTIEVTANDWGVAEVSIINASSRVSYGETAEIFFMPVQVVMPKGIEEGTEQIQADVYVYMPEGKGNLGSYDIDFSLTNDNLEFVDVEDPYLSDNFATPFVEVGTNSLRLWQTSNSGSSSEIVHVGTMLFDVVSIGRGEIYVNDAVLKNVEGEEQGYLASFTNWISETADGALEGVWRWWYNVKPIIDVCVDIFIFPGDNVTNADVNTDIINANAIFSRIAGNCNCNFFLNIVRNSLTNLTAANWNAADTNGDGDIDSLEMDNLVNNHPATGKCVPIYYVPAIDAGDLGWSWEKPPTEGIAIDHSGDGDNRTMAHELSHQLSQGEVEDTGKPNAAAQGANDPGNLMNANNIGDNLTVNQCNLIEKYVNP